MENMTFETFTEELKKELEGRFPEGTLMQTTSTPKNNGTQENALTVVEPGQTTCPNIYLDRLYEGFCHGLPMKDIAEDVFRTWQENRDGLSFDMEAFLDFGRAKDRIVFRLVNYEKNRKLLEGCPHTRFLDLAAAFQYILPDSAGSGHTASVLIKDRIAQAYGVGAEELFRCAMTNTRRLMGRELKDLGAMLADLLGPQAQDCAGTGFVENSMYILTNKQKYYGASGMLYREELKAFADSKGSDLYILPSSVHELILVPASEWLPGKGKAAASRLALMVTEINRTELEPGEVLSDNVYYFDRAKDEVRIA